MTKIKKTKANLKDLASPKGMRDIMNEEYYSFQGFFEKAQEVAVYYGFKPIETPVLEYEKVFEGYYEGSAGFAGLGSLVQTGTRRTEVDGWGTIITPYGTFECLRVKSEVDGVDSISLGATGIPIPNSRTEYYWFGKNQDFPLMEVVLNNFTQQTTIRYKDRYRPELYRNNARFTASRTKATTKDTITLTNQSLNSPTKYTWTITPSTYRFVAGTTANSASPRVLFEAEGVYSVKLLVNYLGGSDDTLRSNYISVTAPTTALVEKAIEKEALSFFPNPGKDLVNFSSGLNQASQVRIYNLLGEEVIAFSLAPQQVLPMNTSTLKSGIYFVELQANGQKVTKKLRID
ncbi:MAG: T9SS type A sorting domain-containing protein [Bacteroidetes bacterium]|nr:T9SS type A sorting domain-containing protein [Bacteroidota bacterium]